MHADHKRLLEVLRQFPADVVLEVFQDLDRGAHCRRTVHEFPDPGPALRPGEDSVVDLDGLSPLERTVGAANFLPACFLEEGARVQRAIGRIVLTAAHSGLPAGSGWGTGSLVGASLLLTNNHVLPSAAFARATAGTVQFNYQDGLDGTPLTPDAWALDPDRVFVTDAALDYTLVGVRERPSLSLPWALVDEAALSDAPQGSVAGVFARLREIVSTPSQARRLRRTLAAGARWGSLRLPAGATAYAVGQYVNIVQHPQGRRKEVAVQDNRVTRVHADVLRYETDTEPGSSGSPVFDNRWDLVALHHAGGDRDADGRWLNNEGIRIDRVVADLRARLPAGSPVLAELGL